MPVTVSDSPRCIRVLVVDDQELIRRGLSLMLSIEPDIEVIGQACDGIEAIEIAKHSRPDVILMDLHMPRMGGVAATREITLLLPQTHILVLTTLETEETVFEAIRAGADAYLLKDASEKELLDTLRAVSQGECRLTPQIALKVMQHFCRIASVDVSQLPSDAEQLPSQSAPDQSIRQAPELDPLNQKEEKILRLITEGMSNKEIADAVFLAEGTVKNYVSRIMEKLHANTRTQLAVISLRRQQEN